MAEVFPWLKNTIPKCESCNEESYFNVNFEYRDSCNSCKINNNKINNVEYGGYIIEPSQENNYTVEAELLCGRRVMYLVVAKGFKEIWF